MSVVGELDIVTAPALAALLRAMIDAGYPQIVVDLTELTFIDARGLNVLAETATHATQTGHPLTVRSTPAFTRRLLDLTEISALVAFETVAPASWSARRLPIEVLAPDGETAAADAPPSLHGLTRSSIDVIDAALRLVTSLAAATVAHADGVSVTLERHGRLMTVAASDDAVLTMDRHQYETGEGPCLDAQTQGRWFYIESLADETRWPRFVPLALGQGIHSILSSPLITADRPQGALNIYSSTRRAFGVHEQQLAALFADRASEILTTAHHDITDDESKQRFAAALITRQTIHQAQGVLMARDGLTAADAISALFQQARATGITVHDRAGEVLASLQTGNGHA